MGTHWHRQIIFDEQPDIVQTEMYLKGKSS